MMKHEFEKLAGYEVTTEDYNNIIEPMYMATNLDKAEFVKCISKERFALPTKAQMERKMRKIARFIFENAGARYFGDEEQEICDILKDYALRFYGIREKADIDGYALKMGTAYRGVRMIDDRGYRFPEAIEIWRGSSMLAEIILVK